MPNGRAISDAFWFYVFENLLELFYLTKMKMD